MVVVSLASSVTARGLLLKCSETTGTVYAFLGIPYAEPPVKSLRFQPTQPIKLWKGERDCTRYGSIAWQDIDAVQLQMYPFKVPKTCSEDCLYLNIWSTRLDNRAKRPVMVWIHGGAFQTGYSNHYDGTFISGYQDVVVVSINYRLGALGFLATGDGLVSGNMGLLDQVTALQWIKRHIKAFGGDPENITLFGESAGSISISYHLLSPLTKGLFRRAICQSGVSLYPSAVWRQQNVAKMLRKRLKKSGIDVVDGKSILEYLLKLPASEVNQVCGEGYQACVDGIFLPDQPLQLYKQGYLHADVDTIFGFNSDEGAIFIYGMNSFQNIANQEEAERILNLIVDVIFFRGSKHSYALKDLLRKEYLSDCDTPERLTHGLVQLHGDLVFVAPTIKSAQFHLDMSKASTYVYAFEERPTFSRYPRFIQADHAQEIMFVFGEAFLGRLQEKYTRLFTEAERKLSKKMIELWCNFAKTGNPNKDGSDEWPQFRSKQEKYISLQHKCEVKSNHKPCRMRLWNEVIPALLSDSKY